MLALRSLLGSARSVQRSRTRVPHLPDRPFRGRTTPPDAAAPDRLPGDGLLPDDAVLLDAPDERLGPALVAAALGDHEPAAVLLAATRAAAEWESRDRYVTRLAAFARGRDEWLTRWLAAAPEDPDALLVHAQLAVRRAWESPARAERLREVAPLIEAAAGATPADPVPWRLALDHARGADSPESAFETCWEQAVRRSPRHFGCHVSALTYLSPRWHGSYRAGFDFAEQAAADAGPDSLIRTLPALAAHTQLRGTRSGGPGTSGRVHGDTRPGGERTSGERTGGERAERNGAVPDERLDAAADLAIGLSARYAPGDPWPAEARNVLAYVLIGRARWEAALDQFRLIGPFATSFPWAAGGDDPLGRFLDARAGARVARALAEPLPGSAGRGRYGDHYA
ncbi:hypothetical protein NX801_12315 [Streptomyces sp. LP05-1]|uniref:DUF4034 domain-containing protein n=2 Tax=Streptomyces pyxinae TaxID=2970734 RepID=A0ABT2CG89_9ACTN|nr:hypothetical protein [Streptomyces sp. LP05-1]MCS0636431.1 hypothetical protein [Streptomyces sp. LP05-1]